MEPFDEIDHAINRGELPEPKPLFSPGVKKALVLLSALFMLGLLLIFLLPYNVLELLSGRIVSTPLHGVSLTLDSGEQLIFSPDVISQLQTAFLAEQEVEFVACIGGSYEESTYYLNSLTYPHIHHQTVFSVRSDACPTDTLLFLHTHPYRSCFVSTQDVKTYESLTQENPSLLFGVMCGVDSFTILTPDRFREEITDNIQRTGDNHHAIFG